MLNSILIFVLIIIFTLLSILWKRKNRLLIRQCNDLLRSKQQLLHEVLHLNGIINGLQKKLQVRDSKGRFTKKQK